MNNKQCPCGNNCKKSGTCPCAAGGGCPFVSDYPEAGPMKVNMGAFYLPELDDGKQCMCGGKGCPCQMQQKMYNRYDYITDMGQPAPMPAAVSGTMNMNVPMPVTAGTTSSLPSTSLIMPSTMAKQVPVITEQFNMNGFNVMQPLIPPERPWYVYPTVKSYGENLPWRITNPISFYAKYAKQNPENGSSCGNNTACGCGMK